ncbi:sorting nexin-22 isoform X2 [Carettochelys insculpta]|uniref:sorting nexin-22 isoform X2 n=1 Tax=Carettochelys insculpta TaxID=44489 RepID=UPI003EBB0617
MLAVSIPAVGPAAEAERGPDKAHTIRKTCKVPDFPPKRVPNWMSKVQEQRRQGLEVYIQGVLYYNTELPKELLDFLMVRHFPQEAKASSLGISRALSGSHYSPGFLLSHRPAVSFHKDPYVHPSATELQADIVLSGVLQGLYGPASPCWGKAALQSLAGPHVLSQQSSSTCPLGHNWDYTCTPGGGVLLGCPG